MAAATGDKCWRTVSATGEKGKVRSRTTHIALFVVEAENDIRSVGRCLWRRRRMKIVLALPPPSRRGFVGIIVRTSANSYACRRYRPRRRRHLHMRSEFLLLGTESPRAGRLASGPDFSRETRTPGVGRRCRGGVVDLRKCALARS